MIAGIRSSKTKSEVKVQKVLPVLDVRFGRSNCGLVCEQSIIFSSLSFVIFFMHFFAIGASFHACLSTMKNLGIKNY